MPAASLAAVAARGVVTAVAASLVARVVTAVVSAVVAPSLVVVLLAATVAAVALVALPAVVAAVPSPVVAASVELLLLLHHAPSGSSSADASASDRRNVTVQVGSLLVAAGGPAEGVLRVALSTRHWVAVPGGRLGRVGLLSLRRVLLRRGGLGLGLSLSLSLSLSLLAAVAVVVVALLPVVAAVAVVAPALPAAAAAAAVAGVVALVVLNSRVAADAVLKLVRLGVALVAPHAKVASRHAGAVALRAVAVSAAELVHLLLVLVEERRVVHLLVLRHAGGDALLNSPRSVAGVALAVASPSPLVHAASDVAAPDVAA